MMTKMMKKMITKKDDLANREAMKVMRNKGANVTANSKAAYQPLFTIQDAHMRSIWEHRTTLIQKQEM